MPHHNVSPLAPIEPTSVQKLEEEKTAPWIVRKLVGSVTGRIVTSSYESLRAAGTSVVCLSPWGDSSPLLLPCIRFRDIAVHTVIVATGGVAAVAAPVMGSVSEVVIGAVGDSILVEFGVHPGFELAAKGADELISHRVEKYIPLHSQRLETTVIKTMTITLKYKHAFTEDANMGFFRSSVHSDSSIFSSVKDYLAVQKGWLSPYLFASGRRPVIPRMMTPDIVFCHTFMPGDYKIGAVLLEESAQVINLTHQIEPLSPEVPGPTHAEASNNSSHGLSIPKLPLLTSFTHMRSRTPSPTPDLVAVPAPPAPRRILLLVLGVKPHRGGLWTTSARPGESVIQYQLLNGCPCIILPARVGTPVIAWDTLTLESIWKTVTLPEPGHEDDESAFSGVVKTLFEYLDLCTEWERVAIPEKARDETVNETDDAKRDVVKDAIRILLASAVKSGESKEVKKQVDKERSGIAMWRII